MPDTPRGYTYPPYTGPNNFPAAIEELARDIDTDVQGLYNDVAAARYAPTAKVSFAGLSPLATGVTTDWPFTDEVYDNAGMVNLGVDPTDISITSTGIYIVSGWAQFEVNNPTGSAGVFLMTTGPLTNIATRTTGVDNDKVTQMSVTALANLGVGEDVTLALRQTTGAPINIQFAGLVVTKVSP